MLALAMAAKKRSFSEKDNSSNGLLPSPADRIAARSPSRSEKEPICRRLARSIRRGRIRLLVWDLFWLCFFRSGLSEYAPELNVKAQEMMESIMTKVGFTDAAQHGWLRATKSGQAQRLQNVATQIVHVANLYVEEQLEKAVANAKAKNSSDLSSDQFHSLSSKDKQVVFWGNALKRVRGDWLHMSAEIDIADAFVTEALPRRIFITTQMISFCENDDELALILGHEVSHLILGHMSENIPKYAIMSTIEILLLSLDPTEGLLSMGIMALLMLSGSALMASVSREGEFQADELGIKLAAMACYDTAKAAEVFYRLYRTHEVMSTTPNILRFFESHPPSLERHEQLLMESHEENLTKYQDTTCASIGTKLKGFLQQPKEWFDKL